MSFTCTIVDLGVPRVFNFDSAQQVADWRRVLDQLKVLYRVACTEAQPSESEWPDSPAWQAFVQCVDAFGEAYGQSRVPSYVIDQRLGFGEDTT